MTNNIIISIIFCTIILIAFWNGYVIRWHLTRVEKYSKKWHAIGFVIRALLAALLFLVSNSYWLTVLAMFVCWLPYNVIINLVNGWKLFYFGEASAIDRFINRIFKKK